jgi:hypothetical protein
LLILKSNINRINFIVAVAFIAILSASTALTGSSLGQVSLTHPFAQLQHQETPLKLWTVDSSSTNNSQTANATKAISDNDTNATNATNLTNATASKAISTNFNPFANVNVQKLITNIRGPVHINFVNSYWTSNTAQDQFVAGTQSGLERLLNSITGSGSRTNEFVTARSRSRRRPVSPFRDISQRRIFSHYWHDRFIRAPTRIRTSYYPLL